jgi:hypothetical protein
MARVTRKLRVCKWIGTALCALMAGALLLSYWWCIDLGWMPSAPGKHAYQVSVCPGFVRIESTNKPMPQRGWHLALGPATEPLYPGMDVLPGSGSSSRGVQTPTMSSSVISSYVTLPIWLLLLVSLIPTLLLWRRELRRPAPGFCRHCDYDLTGNTSGRCPECGLEIAGGGKAEG